jgi:hypothetical protein
MSTRSKQGKGATRSEHQSTTRSKRVLTRKRSKQRKKEHMSKRTNQELGAAYLSTHGELGGARTALGCSSLSLL